MGTIPGTTVVGAPAVFRVPWGLPRHPVLRVPKYETRWAIRDSDEQEWRLFDEDGNCSSFSVDPDPERSQPFGLPSIVDHSRVRGPWERCELPPGEYHPRMWRGYPTAQRSGGSTWSAVYGGVAGLVKRMKDMFQYIQPDAANADAYGHEVRHLLILASTEVEASWRSVLKANGYQRLADPNARLNTNDYVKLRDLMRLQEWRVSLVAHPEWGSMQPFVRWSPDQPTTSLAWYDAYNAVKHDREGAFSRATLRHAADATAAAYIMVLAQFGAFDQQQMFGLGDFHEEQTPTFTAAESYSPPFLVGRRGDDWVERGAFAR